MNFGCTFACTGKVQRSKVKGHGGGSGFLHIWMFGHILRLLNFFHMKFFFDPPGGGQRKFFFIFRRLAIF